MSRTPTFARLMPTDECDVSIFLPLALLAVVCPCFFSCLLPTASRQLLLQHTTPADKGAMPQAHFLSAHYGCTDYVSYKLLHL
jgi:hypothetical protein